MNHSEQDCRSIESLILAVARTVGHLSKSAEVMKASQMAVIMQEFSKEMAKAEVMEEMVNDAVDSALDSEDTEEETEEEVDNVLTKLAAESAAQLPEAIRQERAMCSGSKSCTGDNAMGSMEEEDAVVFGSGAEVNRPGFTGLLVA